MHGIHTVSSNAVIEALNVTFCFYRINVKGKRNFQTSSASQGVLNKKPEVWLDGARPLPKVLGINFKLKMNLSFLSINNTNQSNRRSTVQSYFPLYSQG